MTAIIYPPNGQTWAAIVTKVHDGDTATLDIDLHKAITGLDRTFGFHVYAQGHRLRFHNPTRFYGINAPELVTAEGKAARAALIASMPVGSAVTLTTWLDQADKYGRVLGRLELDNVDINQWMVDGGHAQIYYGSGVKP